MAVSPENLTSNGAGSDNKDRLKLGVLALQGSFLEHINMLRKVGVSPIEVRLPEDLVGLDGLIIPGGESTTIGKLATKFGLIEPLRRFIGDNKAVWGTCAGLIFLAKDIGETGSGGHIIPNQLGVIDITTNRNAFGRQTDSFETDLYPVFTPTADKTPFRAVFIRAPRIESVGAKVEVLARLSNGEPVAVRQGSLLVTSFHPELTNDTRFHQYFLSMM